MMTLLDQGRAAIAQALAQNTPCLAVGRGDSAWTTPPDVALNATGLQTPIAMVRARFVQFVQPDAAGAITMADGTRWTVSIAATPYLHIGWKLEFSDGPEETLRELAVHLNPQFGAGVPPGRFYVAWSDVVAPGAILAAEHLAPLERAGNEDMIERIFYI